MHWPWAGTPPHSLIPVGLGLPAFGARIQGKETPLPWTLLDSVFPPVMGAPQVPHAKPSVSGLPQWQKGPQEEGMSWSLSYVLWALYPTPPFPAQVLGLAKGILLSLALTASP